MGDLIEESSGEAEDLGGGRGEGKVELHEEDEEVFLRSNRRHPWPAVDGVEIEGKASVELSQVVSAGEEGVETEERGEGGQWAQDPVRQSRPQLSTQRQEELQQRTAQRRQQEKDLKCTHFQQ